MTINWITDTIGIADYDDVKRLYRNNNACRPADGQPMPIDCEPRKGHVHLIGTDREPLQIAQINLFAGKVIFKRVSIKLSEKLHKNFVETTDRGFECSKGQK